ncbi:MAG TPA: DUF1499 domain-containing protein [Pirellulales bacterium]|nr:DUF1499 domain-containing protein [Pirellulales bacterium]
MSYVCWFGLALAVISLLGLGASGPGYRLGLWGFETGLGVAKYSAYLSFAAVIVCVLGLALWISGFGPTGPTPALIGLVIGGFVSVWMLRWKHNLDGVPYIHDITTDTENPPRFEAVLPLRAGAPNSAEYGGPELARQQKQGYPDLTPGSLNTSPAETFPRALQAARDMGWEIVASDPKSLRIEATDTTAWFGFKDDVVVRLANSPLGSRIDVRSVSRVGKSDVGTNARRIKAYLARVKQSPVTPTE